MDDVRAVMDAVGLKRAAIVGLSEGGSMSALFAATYPERTSALVLYGAFACRIWSPEYPWAPKLEQRQKWIESLDSEWGGSSEIDILAPSRAHDEDFRDWSARYRRYSVSPSAAIALAKMNTYIDIRKVLPTIHVPTLVLHRSGDKDVDIGNGAYLAKNIPNAKFLELPGEDHIPWAGDTDMIADAIEEFLTGVRPAKTPDRILTTILFTDIVDSTKKANEIGDRRWKTILLRHNDAVRRELTKFRGREVKTTGDGFVATFDGPGRAIRCAWAIAESVKNTGISIRAGLHTGECELIGNDIAGVAVHVAARIAGVANGNEVLVSSTVKDLVSGSGIQFEERGTHSLKGIGEQWNLYSVKGPGTS